MEECNNSIFADRLAIFASTCGFGWRLKSTKLNNSRFSFSTCILVLVKYNAGLIAIPQLSENDVGKANESIAKYVIDMDISRVIEVIDNFCKHIPC